MNEGCMTCLSKEGILVINRVFNKPLYRDVLELTTLLMENKPIYEEIPFRMCHVCFNKKFRLGY